jgi:hypothetical protein
MLWTWSPRLASLVSNSNVEYLESFIDLIFMQLGSYRNERDPVLWRFCIFLVTRLLQETDIKAYSEDLLCKMELLVQFVVDSDRLATMDFDTVALAAKLILLMAINNYGLISRDRCADLLIFCIDGENVKLCSLYSKEILPKFFDNVTELSGCSFTKKLILFCEVENFSLECIALLYISIAKHCGSQLGDILCSIFRLAIQRLDFIENFLNSLAQTLATSRILLLEHHIAEIYTLFKDERTLFPYRLFDLDDYRDLERKYPYIPIICSGVVDIDALHRLPNSDVSIILAYRYSQVTNEDQLRSLDKALMPFKNNIEFVSHFVAERIKIMKSGPKLKDEIAQLTARFDREKIIWKIWLNIQKAYRNSPTLFSRKSLIFESLASFLGMFEAQDTYNPIISRSIFLFLNELDQIQIFKNVAYNYMILCVKLKRFCPDSILEYFCVLSQSTQPCLDRARNLLRDSSLDQSQLDLCISCLDYERNSVLFDEFKTDPFDAMLLVKLVQKFKNLGVICRYPLERLLNLKDFETSLTDFLGLLVANLLGIRFGTLSDSDKFIISAIIAKCSIFRVHTPAISCIYEGMHDAALDYLLKLVLKGDSTGVSYQILGNVLSMELLDGQKSGLDPDSLRYANILERSTIQCPVLVDTKYAFDDLKIWDQEKLDDDAWLKRWVVSFLGPYGQDPFLINISPFLLNSASFVDHMFPYLILYVIQKAEFRLSSVLNSFFQHLARDNIAIARRLITSLNVIRATAHDFILQLDLVSVGKSALDAGLHLEALQFFELSFSYSNDIDFNRHVFGDSLMRCYKALQDIDGFRGSFNHINTDNFPMNTLIQESYEFEGKWTEISILEESNFLEKNGLN